jgi:nicotinamidase-related amidase
MEPDMKLADLIAPTHTAILLSEMQRGICGDLAGPFTKQLAEAVDQAGAVPALRRLMECGRAVGVPTVHATLQFLPNRAGTKINSPMMAVTMKDPNYLLYGSEQAEVIPELAPGPSDVVHRRIHGMSAFTGTELDAILRSLDVRTLIVGGVSLNEAVIGMSIEAINLGYSLVVVRDGSVGLPVSFANDMVEHCFRLLGKVALVDDVIAAWNQS